MKIELEVFVVNLQQGFLLAGHLIVAAYSHHNKIIYVKIPYSMHDYTLPANYRDYKVIHKFTDSFGIEMWTNDGQKTMKQTDKTLS